MKLRYQRWDSDRYLGSKAARLLTLEEQGLYRHLLDVAWSHGPAKDAEQPPALPSDPEEIRFEAGVRQDEWQRCWPNVSRLWNEEDERLVNRVQVKEWKQALKNCRTYHQRAKKAAAARHASSSFKPASSKKNPASSQHKLANKKEIKNKKKSSSSSRSSLEPKSRQQGNEYVAVSENGDSLKDQIRRVFDHWLTLDGLVTHRHLNAGIKRHLTARLKEAYTVDDICQAASRYAELNRDGRAPGYGQWGLGDLCQRGSGEWLDKLLDPNYRGIVKDKRSHNERLLEEMLGNETQR